MCVGGGTRRGHAAPPQVRHLPKSGNWSHVYCARRGQAGMHRPRPARARAVCGAVQLQCPSPCAMPPCICGNVHMTTSHDWQGNGKTRRRDTPRHERSHSAREGEILPRLPRILSCAARDGGLLSSATCRPPFFHAAVYGFVCGGAAAWDKCTRRPRIQSRSHSRSHLSARARARSQPI